MFFLLQGRQAEVILQNETPAAELNLTEASPVCSENPTVAESEEEAPEEQTETFLKEEEQESRENSTSETISSEAQLTCLCVQPNRVRCGVRLKQTCSYKVYMNMERLDKDEADIQSFAEILNSNVKYLSFFFILQDQETLYIIFKSRIVSGSDLEVEFSTEDSDSSKRVLASLENEYTISVPAPGEFLQEELFLLSARLLKLHH